MIKELNFLYLEDDQADIELVKALLANENIKCTLVTAGDKDEFLSILEGNNGFDLILSDNNLPDYDALSALEFVTEQYPSLPFIILSGTLGEEQAIDSMKRGATDYVLKDRMSRLVPAIQRALEESKVRAERIRAEQELIKAHAELEKRVIARTTDLNKANIELRNEISHRIKIEQELLRAMDMVDQASRAKAQFLANMSHELRTPLNAIIGYSEMLQEDARLRGLADFDSDLRKIRDAGKHLLALISDVLDLSKIEAGRMQVSLETFNIRELVRMVEETCQPIAIANGNALIVEIGEDVDSMISDQVRVRQCLLNLLSNASKFTENGEITLQVNRVFEEGNEWILFQVRDTGIGMTQGQIDKIFGDFTQAGADISARYGGTGLGLAIVRDLSRLLGGDVTVESAVGNGSLFVLKLPVCTEIRDQTAIQPSNREQNPQAGSTV